MPKKKRKPLYRVITRTPKQIQVLDPIKNAPDFAYGTAALFLGVLVRSLRKVVPGRILESKLMFKAVLLILFGQVIPLEYLLTFLINDDLVIILLGCCQKC